MMINKIPLFIFIFILFSCSKDDGYESTNDDDSGVIPDEVVNFDLENFPFQTLSEYNFYEGELSSLTPVPRVIPYDLITPLFTDYAKKKRFVWIPENINASYVEDDQVLNFPDGTILIKNFYYENFQPSNKQKIIETRLLYKKNGNWQFAEYVWNEEQTEAYLDLDGSEVAIEWLQNGEVKSTNYRIPSSSECLTCHKTTDSAIPIGPKPQNLNRLFSYNEGQKNQLHKWKEAGFLDDYPNDIETVVNWQNETESLSDRFRSYADINCAHCHSENAHCDYRPLRLAYSETTDLENLGVCVEPDENIDDGLLYIIMSGNKQRSNMYYRLNTEDEAARMPLLGRTLIHDEGVELLEAYINSLTTACP